MYPDIHSCPHWRNRSVWRGITVVITESDGLIAHRGRRSRNLRMQCGPTPLIALVSPFDATKWNKGSLITRGERFLLFEFRSFLDDRRPHRSSSCALEFRTSVFRPPKSMTSRRRDR